MSAFAIAQPIWVVTAFYIGMFTVTQAPPKTERDMIVYGKQDGALGPFRIGPSIGIAISHPINLAIEGRYKTQLGFALNYGFLPDSLVQDTEVKFSSRDLRVRWFPFNSAFFLGSAIGKQYLEASRDESVSGIATHVNATIETTYLTPHLGYRWEWVDGFFLGFDMGWQFGLSAETVVQTNIEDSRITQTDEYKKVVSEIQSVGNDLGRTHLPFMTLLQIGYFF